MWFKSCSSWVHQLLMPVDEEEVLFNILEKMENHEAFKQQVYASVKKVIKLKICLGKI